MKNSKFLKSNCFFVVFQAYTSQFVSLVMFALMMCDDRISMQERRKEIMLGLKRLPGRKTLSSFPFVVQGSQCGWNSVFMLEAVAGSCLVNKSFYFCTRVFKKIPHWYHKGVETQVFVGCYQYIIVIMSVLFIVLLS